MKVHHPKFWLVVTVAAMTAYVPITATAATHLVNPGESIQAAVDAASAGDVVKVNPGVYQEPTTPSGAAVLITKRLKLIARNTKTENVTILWNGDPAQTDGIVVEGTPGAYVERVLIKGFTIEDFPNNGIWLEYANKFKIKNNVSANNLENGIWPTLSTNGLVKNNVAYGALDSGLWVEASENVRVIKNEFYNNPTGLEITVSNRVLAKANDIHDNTVGIGLYHPNGASLPHLEPEERNGDWRIIGNRVYDNNFPNPVETGLVGQLPPGMGVLLVGVDRVTLLKNTIENNDSAGLAIVDWCLFNNCNTDPPVIEDKSDANTVIRNTLTGNGTDPDPSLPPGQAADVTYISVGQGNCFSGNTYATSVFVGVVPGEC